MEVGVNTDSQYVRRVLARLCDFFDPPHISEVEPMVKQWSLALCDVRQDVLADACRAATKELSRFPTIAYIKDIVQRQQA